MLHPVPGTAGSCTDEHEETDERTPEAAGLLFGLLFKGRHGRHRRRSRFGFGCGFRLCHGLRHGFRSLFNRSGRLSLLLLKLCVMLSISLGKGARHRIRYGLGLGSRSGHRLLHLRLCFLLDWLYGSLGSWLGRFGMFGLPLAPQCGRLLLHALMRTLQDLVARSLARVGVRRHAYQSPGFVQFHSRHVVGKRRLQARADLDTVDAALFISARVRTHEGHQNLIHRGLRITRTIQRGNRPHRHAVAHEEGLIQIVVGRIERKLDRPRGRGLGCRLSHLHRLLRCG